MIVDREIMEEFITESREHLETIEDDFLALEKQVDNPDPDLVNKVFRAIHTIKGGSGFLGLSTLTNLTHLMETMLGLLRTGEIKPETRFMDALLRGVDLIRTMLDDVDASNDIDTSQLSVLLRWLMEDNGVDNALHATPVRFVDELGRQLCCQSTQMVMEQLPKNFCYFYVLKYNLLEMGGSGGFSPVALIRELLKTGRILDSLVTTPKSSLEEGLPGGPLIYKVLYATMADRQIIAALVGLEEKRVMTVQIQTEGQTFQDKDPLNLAVENKLVCMPAPEVETGPHGVEAHPHAVVPRNETVRICVNLLDKLMMLTGELVLVRNQQALAVDSMDVRGKGVYQRLNMVTTELQETVMQTRLQPVGFVVWMDNYWCF